MAVLKIGVLISGRGSNLQALIDAERVPGYAARIGCVISNVADAAGLDRAKKAGIPTEVIDHKTFKSREEFDTALDARLKEYGVELVCLAGFMRMLSAGFVEKWRDKLINIHPSLLPAFPGLNVHRQALKAGVKLSGCTVHFVRADLDNGPIIAQGAVPVLTDDTEGTLADRVLEAEHKLYPLAVNLIAESRVNVYEERVFIADAAAPSQALFNPSESRALPNRRRRNNPFS